jgi:hypothetical protein
MPRDWVKSLPRLEFFPIEDAPIKPGEIFGPCVLAPAGDDLWTVGQWNGAGWFGTDGLPRTPKIWAKLPDPEFCC